MAGSTPTKVTPKFLFQLMLNFCMFHTLFFFTVWGLLFVIHTHVEVED